MTFTIDALSQEDFVRERRQAKASIAFRSGMLMLCTIKGAVGAGAVYYIGAQGGELAPGVDIKTFGDIFAPIYFGFWAMLGAREISPIRRCLNRLSSITSYQRGSAQETLPPPRFAIGNGG